MINIKIDKDWIPFIAIAVLIFILLGQCSSNAALREDIKELKQTVSIADNKSGSLTVSVETKSFDLVFKKVKINLAIGLYFIRLSFLTDSSKYPLKKL